MNIYFMALPELLRACNYSRRERESQRFFALGVLSNIAQSICKSNVWAGYMAHLLPEVVTLF